MRLIVHFQEVFLVLNVLVQPQPLGHFVVFLEAPSACANAKGTVDSHINVTTLCSNQNSSKQIPISWNRADLLICALDLICFAREANVFKFNFDILLQKDTSSLSILCLLNFFASSAPVLKQSTSCSAASCGITSPVTMFRTVIFISKKKKLFLFYLHALRLCSTLIIVLHQAGVLLPTATAC